jgi:hypothetical protein
MRLENVQERSVTGGSRCGELNRPETFVEVFEWAFVEKL